MMEMNAKTLRIPAHSENFCRLVDGGRMRVAVGHSVTGPHNIRWDSVVDGRQLMCEMPLLSYQDRWAFVDRNNEAAREALLAQVRHV